MPLADHYHASARRNRSHVKGIGERFFVGPAGSFGYPGQLAGDKLEAVLHYRHWVFAAIRAIGDFIAGLKPQIALVTEVRPEQRKALSIGSLEPVERNKRNNDIFRQQARERFLERRWQKSNQTIQPHEEIEPLDSDHPLCRLVNRPNEMDTLGQFLYELVMFRRLCGIAYIWKVPNKLGRPCELWVVPSHWVRPHVSESRQVDYYLVMPFVGGFGSFKIPVDEIISLPYKNPMSKIDGWSPQYAGAEAIDCYESIQRSRFWQFKQGCFPVGAIETAEGQFEDPDQQDLDRIGAQFYARYQGESNTGKPVVLPPGAKYVPLTIAPANMGYLDSSPECRDNVLSMMGPVPKEIVGIQDAGSEIAMYGPIRQFAMGTINPETRYLGASLTLLLAHLWDERIRIWWPDAAVESPDQVRADIATQVTVFAITPNEVRATYGREPYAHGGDDPIVSGPLGPTPLPLNTGEDFSDLADLMAGGQQEPPAEPSEEGAVEETESEPLPRAIRERISRNGHAPKKLLTLAANGTAKTLEVEGEPVTDDAIKIRLPDLRQGTNYSCGASAFQAIAEYFGVGPETEAEFMEALGTDPGTVNEGGTEPQRIIDYATELKLQVEARGNMTLAELKAYIDDGWPVIVLIQAWGEPSNYASDKEGHYVDAVGYDDERVYFEDPSLKGVRGEMTNEEFELRWHDRGSNGHEYHHFGIALFREEGVEEIE